MPSPSLSTKSGSQALPIPSPSASSCPGLKSLGQLSEASTMPSPSLSTKSGSQALPIPSLSASSCPGLKSLGQLSEASTMPSPSLSTKSASWHPGSALSIRVSRSLSLVSEHVSPPNIQSKRPYSTVLAAFVASEPTMTSIPSSSGPPKKKSVSASVLVHPESAASVDP